MTRSVRIHEFGGADVLKIENVTVGEPGPGQVRLRIHALGLNRTEVTLRSGRSPVKPSLPSSIGFEAAGVIEALGPDVSGFVVGDRVALVPAYSAAQYALYGEVSLAPARSLVAIPDNISFSEAAATWVAYGTAWGGLVAIGALGAGQTVLIPAASSSVGLAAIHGRGAHPSQSRHAGRSRTIFPIVPRISVATACAALTRGLAVHPGDAVFLSSGGELPRNFVDGPIIWKGV